ncbi:MAG: ABC transporter substrate-binding protein [Gammaproteobacteria bacterium]|nr:MAG: ABC transporter substrate-binding protein [Gammaproteobacteria bacterium]
MRIFDRRTLVAALGLLGAWAAGAVELKIATLAPEGTAWMKQLRAAAARVERESDGRVRLKFYPGGVMGNDQAVLRKLRVGQLHGGALTAGALADRLPDAQIYGLPLLFETWEEAAVVRRVLDPLLQADARRAGLELLGVSSGGFAYVASREPAPDIEALKRQRVWVPQGDRVGTAMFQVAGITPVPLPLPEVYTALQTGLLDAVVTTPTSLIAFQWHSQLEHFTDAPLAFVVGFLVVDARAFGRLEEADQALLRRAVADAFAELDRLNARDDAAAREALAAAGLRFWTPGPAERARWRALAERAWQALAEEKVYSPARLQRVLDALAAARRAP